MKKNFLLLITLCLLGLFSYTKVAAVNTTATVTWPFSTGVAGQGATYSSGASNYLDINWVSVGSNLTYNATVATCSITFTQFKPVTNFTTAAGGANDYVGFSFRPLTGYKFTATSISFDCVKAGTDGARLDVYWKSSLNSVASSIKLNSTVINPMRNSGNQTGNIVPRVTLDLSSLSIPESDGDCVLYFNLYALGSGKSIGLANVTVNGTVTGEAVVVTKYALNTLASPSAGGTVTVSPVGTNFNEGSSITLTATRGFGYKFSNWTDQTGTIVSTSNPYTFGINAAATLTAVFTPINTYSLGLTASNAPTYMINVSPAWTAVNGAYMYEDGTSVALTAYNNQIFTFNNWLTGETNSSLTVPMTQNQSVSATYSAIDYIVGWDFYKSGGSSRPADFYSTSDNQTATLVLRKADGTLNSWLDKSNVALSTAYNSSRGAAISWKPLADQYYFQTSFNAKDFTDIKVSAGMQYSYNTYSVQKCEYSIDGTNFSTLGTYTMTSSATWYDNTFSLPSDANHVEKVYIRWIPDYTSEVKGTVALANDGITISNIFVTATAATYDDGIAPVLSSSIPSSSTINASATGKVVLTFDEKVMLTSSSVVGTLAGKQLTPAVSGKTITFPYTALDYGTQYTFTLPANSVSDLAGNTMAASITISFTTMTRPTVTKKLFDFVVGVDGDFKAALTAATAAASSAPGVRYRIFFPTGEYNIGGLTGDANQMTTVALPNVSYIGESATGVILYNKSTTESINSTATMYFTSATSGVYMQDLGLMNKMDYRNYVNGTLTLVGRGVALWDQGTKNIYKNVELMSNQDTYYSGAGRYYFENSTIHGTVDFICGGGDIFFNESTLYLEGRSSGDVVVAPSTTTSWGYIFNSCTIDGASVQNGIYSLGRPWQNSPRAVYLNTKMNLLPTALGWSDMGVLPALFAEYNSVTASGTAVDVSSRKTSFTVSSVSTPVSYNPVLTADQAAQYTIENVLGGTDTWQPKLYTEQAQTPVISFDGTTITWNDNPYTLCWAVCKNGQFVSFTTTNSYTVPASATNGTVYTIRAANEMGGLSDPSNPATVVKELLKSSVAWSNPSAITYGTALSATQLNAVVTGTTGAVTYTPALGTVLNAGTNTLTVTFATDNIYTAISKTVEIVVNKATPVVSWSNPAAITYGTALSATQLNATTNSNSSAVYSSTSGTILNAGSYTLRVDYAESNNFFAASKTVSLVVNKANPVINWISPDPIKYGTALSELQLNAVAIGTTGAVSYSPASGTIPATGTITITASFDADANYEAASKTVSLLVTEKNISVATWATPASIVYGTALSENELKASVVGTSSLPAYSPASGTVLSVGTYTLTAFFAGDATYEGVTKTVSLTVKKAPLTITASSLTKTYGASITISTSQFTANGLVGSNTITSVSLLSSGTQTTALIGAYEIVASSAVGVGLSNYDISYVSGTLTVNKAALTVSASSQTKLYGATLTLTGSEISASGLKNSDKVSSATLVSPGTSATAVVNSYDIIPSVAIGTGLSNYDITYSSGTLTVNKASLKITGTSLTKTYGASLTITNTEYSVSGLYNSDKVNSVSISCSGTDASSAVGSYAVIPSNADITGSSNYTVIYASGTLTISKAAAKVYVNNQSKTYGSAISFAGTEFTTSGLLNSDAITSVTLASSGSVATASVATYAITASSASGSGVSNYTISYTAGSLTVSPAALSISANNQSKVYGSALTLAGTEIAATGLKNSDAVSSVTLASDGTVATAAVKNYAVTPSAAVGTGLSNYTISYTAGTLTVSPAALSISANNQSKVYGSALTLTGTEFTSDGLKNSDAVSSVTLASDGTVATAAVNNYAVTPSAAVGTGLSNYTISYTAGTLTVSPAALSISANNQTKVYGTALTLAGTEFASEGLKNSDAVSSVTLTSAGTAATAAVNNYTLTPSAAVGTGLSNYTISYTAGSVTVTKASLKAIATSVSKVYGAELPTLAISYTGFANNESESVISTKATALTTASASSIVGTYAISVSGASASNYSFVYVPATLTITKATLIIAANDTSVQKDKTLPVFVYSVIGFVNGDTEATAFSGTPELTADVTSAKVGDTVSIVVANGTLSSDNYEFSFVNGTLTITKNTKANEVNVAEVSVYPNPVSSGNVVIKLQDAQKATITVLSLNGAILVNKVVNSSISEINVDALPSGSYYIRVANEKGIVLKPFVKQ